MENFCQPARLSLQQDTPYSEQFQDVYFSSDEGCAESRYVFLQHNGLPERWQQNTDGDTFIIAETGFGSGLNFYLTLQHWCATPKRRYRQLHYMSSELHPFTRQDFLQLRELLFSRWPALRPDDDALLSGYPGPVGGFHTLSFSTANVTLTLLFGDNTDVYQQLLLPPGQGVDAWYLDGFAPGRNQQMWTPTFMQRMAQLSRPGASVSTFTAASEVRRSLQAAGFTVNKVPGYGRKREMLTAQRSGAEQPLHSTLPPWFALPETNRTTRELVVIGAGLAGSAVAYQLATRGYQVTVLEREPACAQGASSNRAGVVYPPINQQASAEYQYYAQAYRAVIRQLQDFAATGNDLHWSDCGVLQLAQDETRRQRYRAFAERATPDYVRWLSCDEASEQAGVALEYDGLLFPQGGYVDPQALCRRYLQHPNITCRYHTEVAALQRKADGWMIRVRDHTHDAEQAETLLAEQVVIATADDSRRLLPGFDEFIAVNRGQVSYLSPPPQLQSLRSVVCYAGYATPSIDGVHVIGATSDDSSDTAERVVDHATNLAQLNEVLSAAIQVTADPAQLQGNIGFRTVTPDHLPLVGPVPDLAAYADQYQDLHHGRPRQQYPAAGYLPGLFVSVAHGARGISSSWLAAELIGALLAGEVLPVPHSVYQAVHPARFRIRALQRGNR